MNQRYWDKVCETFERMLYRGTPHDNDIPKEPLKMNDLDHLTYLEESLIMDLMYIEHAKSLLDKHRGVYKWENVKIADFANPQEDTDTNADLMKKEEETDSISSEKTQPVTSSNQENEILGIGTRVILTTNDTEVYAKIINISRDYSHYDVQDAFTERNYYNVPRSRLKAAVVK